MSVQSEIKFRARKNMSCRRIVENEKLQGYSTRRSARKLAKECSEDAENIIQTITPTKLYRKTYTELCNQNRNTEQLETDCSSPPKIHRTEAVFSPKSPSTLLNNLHIASSLEQKTLEPKTLFPDQRWAFQTVKQALHSSAPEEMPGRESEISELTQFLTKHFKERQSASMYISGPPGTGKTAALNYILQNIKLRSYKDVYLNCTSIKSAVAIYSHLIDSLRLKPSGRTERDKIACLEKYLSSSKQMTLLVLDEIDQLESRKQSVLYRIFEWPARYPSGLLLVGIANALDLTDRILPRLQAHTSLKPTLLHFAPYRKEQIAAIFRKRLEEAGVLDIFAPAAIQILSAKVAAVSGDLRRALDIGRRAVELAEQYRMNHALQASQNLETPVGKIELKDVMAVLNTVFATTQQLDDTIEAAFPLQQKIVLCTLILMLRKGNKDITVGKLHDVYKRVCAKRNILGVDQAEFVSLLTLIETRGILRVSGKRDVRLQKLSLEWDEDEVVNVMKDKNLMAAILEDVTCLGSN